MTIRTVAPATYIPPTASDIRRMAKQVGIDRYSNSLVEDLCNVQAGGEFVPDSDIERRLAKNIAKVSKGLSKALDGDYRFNDEWLKDEQENFVSDRDKAYTLVAKKQVQYHTGVQQFIKTLDFSNVPGYSPLEKSMGLLKLLGTQEGGCPESGEDDELGNSLPIFSQYSDDRKDPKKTAERINEVLDNLSNLDDHERILCNICAEGKSPLAMAEDMMDGRDVMLQIKRQLDKVCSLQTNKYSVLKPDPNGNEVRYRSIKHISEFSRLHPSEWMYPEAYRNYRLLNGVSQVRERCSKLEKKKLLYVICDCSGSMSGDRFLKAGGVVMNQLKGVLRGEADMWLAFFHNSLGEEFQASSENIYEVKKLMSKIKASNFDQGGTSIANCTREAIQRIEKKRKRDPKLIKPQLVIITDGDDNTSSLKIGDLGGITLNTVLVGGRNPHLIDVSRASGGCGITVL